MHAHGPVQYNATWHEKHSCTGINHIALNNSLLSSKADLHTWKKRWTLKEASKALHLILAPAEWPEIRRVGSQLLQLCASAIWNLLKLAFSLSLNLQNFQNLQARYVVSFWSRMWKPSNVSTWYRSLPDRWSTWSVSVGVRYPLVLPLLGLQHWSNTQRGKCWNKQSRYIKMKELEILISDAIVFTCLFLFSHCNFSQPRTSSTATTVAFSGSSSITALILIPV